MRRALGNFLHDNAEQLATLSVALLCALVVIALGLFLWAAWCSLPRSFDDWVEFTAVVLHRFPSSGNFYVAALVAFLHVRCWLTWPHHTPKEVA